MNKETTKLIPGDELHLTMLMAPYSLNLVTGQDRQHLLAFGRAAFDAGKEAGQATPCLHQLAEPAASPFMYAIADGYGNAFFEEQGCVSSEAKDLQPEVDSLNQNLDGEPAYAVVAVYTHPAAQQAAAHPDDAAVDALAALMKAKLAEKRAKGYGGWNDKTQCPQQRLSDMLRAHVDKGDPVDVANFCAMLSARGEGIAAAPQAVQAAEPEGWKLAPIKVPDSAFAWVSGGYPAGYKAGDKRDTAVVHERAQRTWEAILNGITAPAHPAEGVPAQAGAYAEARECEHCNHVGINDAANGIASCTACKWNGDSPKEDKCPDCEAEGTMTASCPKCHHEYRLIADATLAATQPAAQGMDAQEEWVPQPEKVNRYCGCHMCLETDVEHEPSCRRHPSQAKQGGA